MKTKLQFYVQSVAVLLALTLLFSLLFSILYFFTLISTSTFHILSWIGGCIAYACGGIILGINIKKKALLNAFIMIVILGSIALLLSDFTILSLLEICSKLFAYVLGTMLLYTAVQTH